MRKYLPYPKDFKPCLLAGRPCDDWHSGNRRHVRCDVCGSEGARIRHVTRSYGKGKRLFVIENVPIINCPHCGESYMTAEILHEIERIKLHKQAVAVKRTVPVAAFA